MKKFKIRIPRDNTDIFIKTPISLETGISGQIDLVEREFINVELEKAINPIIDNETTRYKPVFNNELVNTIRYNVFFNSIPTTWDMLGFTQDDLEFNLNRFKRTFLRLEFFDSEVNSDNNFLFKIDLFPEIYEEDRIGVNQNGLGRVRPINQINVRFESYNGGIFLDRSSDGFDIFALRRYLSNNSNVNFFMKSTLFNASSGEITPLVNTNNNITVLDLNNNSFTDYQFSRDTNKGFCYELDNAQSNVSYDINSKTYNINLYKPNII